MRQPGPPHRVAPRRQRFGQPYRELEVARQGADLAAEFIARVERQAIIGTGTFVMHHTPALQRHLQRPIDIVQHRTGGNRAKQHAPHRRDGPRDPDLGVDEAFLLPHPLLDAPVQADAGLHPRRRFQGQIAADGPDGRICKVLNQAQQSVIGPGLPGIGEHQNVAARPFAGLSQCGRFADVLGYFQDVYQAVVLITACDVCGPIGRAVRNDDQFPAQAGAVHLPAQFLDAWADGRCFVSHRHDQGADLRRADVDRDQDRFSLHVGRRCLRCAAVRRSGAGSAPRC